MAIKKAKKVAVILNGCGHRDGTEIHEAVLTLLAIEEAGATWEALAVDSDQARVLNHVSGSVDAAASPRNMLQESARIARGRIRSMSDVNPGNYSAVIIPGGNGTASNLCNFATAGKGMTVSAPVESFLKAFHMLKRPIGAVCIAPVILAKIFGEHGLKLTLGDAHGEAAQAAAAMGARPEDCAAIDCIVDEKLRMVTTPAYMLEASIADIAKGISSLVNQVLRMAPDQAR